MGAIGSLYVFILIKMEILAMSLSSTLLSRTFNRITRNHSISYSFRYNSKKNVH